jgi:hypothetical protein
MDHKHENGISRLMSRACAATAGAPLRPAGSRSIEGQAALRLVHSADQHQGARVPRAVPAAFERADKRVWAGSRAAGTPDTGAGLTYQEVFDCRTWQRGNAQPVLIAAMAGTSDSAARAGFGAALAVSALVNILDEEMTEDLETGRLSKLLRGTVGEVQLIRSSLAFG